MLDGVAAVNIAEPSPGDLERVIYAYAECRKQLHDCLDVLRDVDEWMQDRIGYEENEPMDGTHQEVWRVIKAYSKGESK